MTTTVPGVSEDTNLDAACTTVAAEVPRTDGKASLLLAFNGVVLAGLTGAANTGLPAVTTVVGAATVLTLGAAAVLLLLVVRPRLQGTDRASFPYWASLDDDTIRTSMRADARPARIRGLSGIALRKHRQLKRAVDLSLAALALLLIAAASALI
ncbi:Pycsar system effector family protein [Streptomyces griseorubiginosus]|uniref:Integral membrane plasmid transfer protein n=1 Tax=Streptomyces griseorubiginosus TaxID=67304 RepID=A0A117QWN1_9ACTN|nr:Pycsar system effector family protein [Streptomyces griseorubiginosus]KUN58440.1 integral membrane plasmid transfer protein [Streptomyces griseorubiginosus]